MGGSSPVSFDPRGDGKSEVVSDVEVTGPDHHRDPKGGISDFYDEDGYSR